MTKVRVTSITVCMLLFITFVAPSFTQAAPVQLQGGVLKEGRVYVPMRALFESMGATIIWDNEQKMVNAYLKGTEVKMVIGAQHLSKNGKRAQIDSPAFIHNGRTLIPLRATTEAFGGKVSWDSKQKLAGYKLDGKEALVKIMTEDEVINETFLSFLEKGTYKTCPFSMKNPPTKGELIAKYGEPIDRYEGGGGYAMLFEGLSCSPTIAYVNDTAKDTITGIMFYDIPEGMTPENFISAVGKQPDYSGDITGDYSLVYYAGNYAAILSAPDKNSTIQGIYIKSKD